MVTPDSQNWGDEAVPLLLTLTGASVDAMVILGFNVLTAAQTGNTVLLAVAIARGDAVTGLSAATSVAAFAAGCFLGEFAISSWRNIVKTDDGVLPVVVVEAVLLTMLLLFWRVAEPVSGYHTVAIVVLAAFTMGLQSAAVLHVHGPATTYMTGMLATFSTGLVRWLGTGLSPTRRETVSVDRAQANVSFPWRNGLGWLIYLGGAILCGSLFLRFGALAMIMPIGISIVLIGLLSWRAERAERA